MNYHLYLYCIIFLLSENRTIVLHGTYRFVRQCYESAKCSIIQHLSLYLLAYSVRKFLIKVGAYLITTYEHSELSFYKPIHLKM